MQFNWRPLQDWQASLQANWVMDRNRAANDLRKEIDDYVLVDFTVRRSHLFDNVELALNVTNLFDEDAYEPSRSSELGPAIPNDLPLQGRAVMGEVRYNF